MFLYRLVILMTHLQKFMNAALNSNLSMAQTMAVMQDISDTMNGDGLYDGASTEVILEAFYNQECSDAYGLNWTDHIAHILQDMELSPQEYESVRLVCQNTQLA